MAEDKEKKTKKVKADNFEEIAEDEETEVVEEASPEEENVEYEKIDEKNQEELDLIESTPERPLALYEKFDPDGKIRIVQYEIQKKDDLLDKYYKKAINALRREDKEEFINYYLDQCNSGENRFYQKNITETKTFDEGWIDIFESLIVNVDNIIRNPKMGLRYESDVVAIEKAKKTNSESVRHLASHTQFITEIDEDGFVKPKKILTTWAEEEIATYENRFIMTLILRMYQFVQARYEIIKENVDSFQYDHLVYTSRFDLKDEGVNFKLDVKIKRDLDNPEINRHNHEFFKRVEKVFTYVSGFRSSPFMRAMKSAGAKKVFPPIMKTNVILKNADFKQAYNLWLFLDRYSAVIYDLSVRERPVRLSRTFKSNIDHISAFGYAALVNNKKKRQEDFTVIERVDPVVKKSTKIAKTDISDVIKNPDAIIIQNNLVNEYYLELNKQVIKNKIKEMIEEQIPEASQSRKIVKESIDITNNIFDSYFNLEENIDYFEKFSTKSDPGKAYKEAKDKVRIAKIIREAKEKDLIKSIKLEKSLYKTMRVANNEKIRAVQEEKRKEVYEQYQAQIDKEFKQLMKERKRILALIRELDGKIVDIETGKTGLEQELDQLKAETDADVAAIKEQVKAEYAEKMKKLEEENAAKLAAEKAELKEKLDAAKKRKAERVKELKKKKAEAIRKAKEAEEAKLKKELEAKKKKFKEEIEKVRDVGKKKIEEASTINEDEI